jgi:predicted nucleic acid-binding protein
MFFLDTNIFMYAAGAEHPYKAPCIRILSDIENGIVEAAGNTEVLQELLYRYTHIRLADKGIQLCREVLLLTLAIFSVTESDLRLAIDLFEAHRTAGFKPRDAIHAATMQNHGIVHIISANADFDRLGALVRIDPLTYT